MLIFASRAPSLRFASYASYAHSLALLREKAYFAFDGFSEAPLNLVHSSPSITHIDAIGAALLVQASRLKREVYVQEVEVEGRRRSVEDGFLVS